MSELTIVSANVNSPEWGELLVKSIMKYSSVTTEIIIIDNHSLESNLEWFKSQKAVTLVKLPVNIGHGNAMDLGTLLAKSNYICVLDIDSFIQRKGWETDLIDIYRSDDKIKLIGVRGPEHKPLHPPLFFYEKKFIIENNIFFRYFPRQSTDTAQKAYWDILNLGFKVHRLEKGTKIWHDCMGDEIYIKDKQTIYHHWYGTRFNENNPDMKKDKLDGYSLEQHIKEKEKLFSKPEVKEILK